MTIVPDDIWKLLTLQRPSGDELVARAALPAITLRLLAAVDARDRRHLLIALNDDDEACEDTNSRGLSVVTQDLILPGSAHGRYINLSCEDVAGHPMLDLIGGEIAERLRTGGETPAENASRVIAKWRRFWGQIPRQLLSREAQVGLFAELWFLVYWLIPAVGIASAVQRWRGPHDGRHDFEYPGLSIEVKGGTCARGGVFKINGVRQLEPPEGGRLLFFGLQLREEAGASNTLPMLVDACRHSVAPDADAEGLLDAGLITAGYLAAHADEYAKNRWRVVEERLVDVTEDFPRIVGASFPCGLPQGVEQLEYTINLGTFGRLVVAKRPSDATSILQRP
ncbi:MAG: PD-(D/E)XK motif protein [Betaproteobacteria bacterium]|nr:PD-(D/E)XK motif protein [Betaproteobacteria bacterium]